MIHQNGITNSHSPIPLWPIKSDIIEDNVGQRSDKLTEIEGKPKRVSHVAHVD